MLIHKEIADSDAMMALGSALAAQCYPAMHVYLSGDLGAGKTTLVRGFMRGLGFQGKVKSPTYNLVEPYVLKNTPLGNVIVNHFDLYRINDPMELEDVGWRDYLDGQALCLLEWPENAGKLLAKPDLDISIIITDTGRLINMTAHNDRIKQCLKTL